MPFAWDVPPLIVAHRGAPRVAKENTLVSFAAALAEGVRAFELDARLTRDGVVVVHHDAELGRTFPGDAKIAAVPHAGLPDGIPTLQEVLAAFPAALVDVELKPDAENADDLPAAVWDVVRSAGAEDRVLATSFDAALAEDYAERSGRPAGLLSPLPVDAEDVAEFERLPFVLLAVDAMQENVRSLREAGRRVGVWTVNDPANATRLLDMGAEFVITDRPGALAQATRGRGGAAR